MTITPPATARRTPIALYVGVSLPMPARITARIAERLPVAARAGVPPHITLVHAQVSPEQVWRLRAAFEDGAFSVSLADLEPFRVRLEGVGDFRGDEPPTPVVYLRVTDESGQLASLAAAFDAEYGLRRRFDFHPHVTLAWRNRDLELAEGDAELDRLKAAYADFTDEFTVETLEFTRAHGTILTPRVITWGTPHPYPLR